jgi:hypothetical protein
VHDRLGWLERQLPGAPICLIMDQYQTHDTDAISATARALGFPFDGFLKAQMKFPGRWSDALSAPSNRRRDSISNTASPATGKWRQGRLGRILIRHQPNSREAIPGVMKNSRPPWTQIAMTRTRTGLIPYQKTISKSINMNHLPIFDHIPAEPLP